MYIRIYVYLGECSWVCRHNRGLPSVSSTQFPSDGLGRPPLRIKRLHDQSPRWDWTQDHEVAKHRRYHWTTRRQRRQLIPSPLRAVELESCLLLCGVMRMRWLGTRIWSRESRCVLGEYPTDLNGTFEPHAGHYQSVDLRFVESCADGIPINQGREIWIQWGERAFEN